jgi:gliding motility-associated lipoprotein GldH
MRQLLLLSAILILVGCSSSNTLFEEHQSVGDDLVWQPSEPITFTIDVKENKHAYEMAVAVRYANGYPFDKLPIYLIETGPSGESVRKDIDIIIQPEPGEYLGEKGLDIIDLEHVVDTNKEFPEFGKYTYTLMPNIDDPSGFPLLMEIGLILRDPQQK